MLCAADLTIGSMLHISSKLPISISRPEPESWSGRFKRESTRRYRADMANTRVCLYFAVLDEDTCGLHEEKGTWVPLAEGRILAERNGVLDKLLPIFDFVPGDRSPPPAPKHATAASNKPKTSRQSAAARRMAGMLLMTVSLQTTSLTLKQRHNTAE